MALRDLIPGPLNLILTQLRDLCDALDARLITGIGTSFTLDGAELWDNGYWISQTGYHQHSPLARILFWTDATSVDVDVYANFTPDAGTAIQIWVDGLVYASPGLAFSSGAQTITQSLPAGHKLVSIVSGVQAIVSGSIIGTFLTGCTFNQSALQLAPEAPARVVIYGDSTSQGGGGGSTGKNIDTAWPIQFRKLSTRSIVAEAASGRSLWDDTNTSTLRGLFVAKLVAMNASAYWFLIGTNDHAGNKWSASTFGTNYAATIDDLHTALPNVKVYCQTPLFRANAGEAANGSGNILEDYREQIRTIARDRASWAVLVEGPAVLGKAEMLSESSSWVHPNDLGNYNLARYVDATLNGAVPGILRANYGAQEDVTWTGQVNVSTSGSSITKNAGTDGSPDAGGVSTKAIAAFGQPWYVRFTTTETNKTRVFGVSSSNSLPGSGTNLAQILYGFNAFSTGAMLLWENGAGYESGGQAYSAGDSYQVRGEGADVYFERIRSGVVTTLRKSSVPVTPSMFPLYVFAVILGSSGTITDARMYGLLQ